MFGDYKQKEKKMSKKNGEQPRTYEGREVKGGVQQLLYGLWGIVFKDGGFIIANFRLLLDPLPEPEPTAWDKLVFVLKKIWALLMIGLVIAGLIYLIPQLLSYINASY